MLVPTAEDGRRWILIWEGQIWTTEQLHHLFLLIPLNSCIMCFSQIVD